MTLRARLMDALAVFVVRRPWAIVLCATAATVAALGAIRDIPFDVTFFSILPLEHPEVQLFNSAVRDFGGSSNLLILIEDDDPSSLTACADALAETLPEIQEVVRVDHRVDHEILEHRALLYIEQERLERLANLLEQHQPSIEALLTRPSLHAALTLTQQVWSPEIGGSPPTSPAEAEVVLGAFDQLLTSAEQRLRGVPSEPGALARALRKPLDPSTNAPDLQATGGYLLSPDRTALLVLVGLATDPLHSAFGFDVYERVKAIGDSLASDHAVKIGYAGHFAMGYEDQNRTLDRVKILSAVSLLLVVGIFVLVLRSRWAPALVVVPLLLGVLWTFGLVRLVLGQMTLTSAVFGIALFGLAVDFAIHLLFRLGEEFDAGAPPEEVIRITLRTTGLGVITGGVTTSIAFFALNVSDFRGAHHLGTTTGMGMLCCMVAFVVIMPAMVAAIGRRSQRAPLSAVALSFGPIDMIVDLVCRRPRTTLAIAIAATVLLALPIRDFRLVYDLEKIIQQDLPSVATRHRIEKRFSPGSEFAMVPAANLAEARQIADALRACPTVSRVESPSDLLPVNQAARLPLARRVGSLAAELLATAPSEPAKGNHDDPDALAASLERLAVQVTSAAWAAGRLDEKTLAVTARCSSLSRLLRESPDAAQRLPALNAELGAILRDGLELLAQHRDTQPLELSDLPPAVANKFRGKSGRLLVMAHPVDHGLNRESILAFKHDVRAVNQEATSLTFMVELMVRAGLDTLPQTLMTIVALIGVVLLLDFRRVSDVLLTLIPLGFGATWGLGVTCLVAPVISILMLGAFPLIFGIAIDDGVHLIHRFRETGGLDVRRAVAATGKAIFFTSLTTALSFGCLLLTNHTGLAGLGLLVSLGVAACFVTSITVLPAILQLVVERRQRSG